MSLYNSESVQGGLESMRQSRANEISSSIYNLRRANDRQSKSRKRASETEQETVEHRASDRQCKAKRRANEMSKRLLSVELGQAVSLDIKQILIFMPRHIRKPRSLYAAHVADYKVWSRYLDNSCICV